MKRDLFTLKLDLGNELIIDNFAGGGGTSTGLEAAFGRPVDIAINHDPEALAMHAINHPHTRHLCESVWDVDPIEVTKNQPVALVWLSPDCKHFSKAKGGTPVKKHIRGLAWVALRWASKCKPRVIALENVEEFKTWGPVIIDEEGNARPDPAKKGKTFESFVRQLRAQGYTVEWREFRACDFGAPTIRKRFFLIARRDGLPVAWPEPSHGAPTSPGVLAGKLLPHRTAAECIDWSLDCPSIFTRKRPLADATLRRIAKGIMRYVVNAENPFIVGAGGPAYGGKPTSIDMPLGTLTTENHRAVVVPTIVNTANSKTTGRGPNSWSAEEPFRTITSAPGFAVVAPTIVPVTHQGSDRVEAIDEPMRTITGAQRGEKALAAAYLSPYYSDKRPADARGQQPGGPINTIPTENRHALVTAVLVDAAHGEQSPSGVKRWGQGVKDVEQPLGTVVASGNKALATAFLAKHYTGVVGSDLVEPIGTVTSTDHHSLVTAHIQRDMGKSIGHATDVPLATITAGGGGKSAVVASTLVKLRGTSSTAAVDEPLHTVSAGGQHHAEVRAFLVKYYGADQDPRLEEPLHTITTKDRFGLVTIQGVDYEIVDIGLRMLAPHELYLAQGFPAAYIINEVPDPKKLFANGEQVPGDPLLLPRVPLTKSAQVRMCGNSVCPPMSEALILANFAHEQSWARAA